MALRGITSIGASCTIGDVVCQSLSKTDGGYDVRRTAVFAASGLFVLGPVSYSIITFGTHVVPGTSLAAVLQRVTLVQCLEPLRLGLFLPTPLLLSGASFEAAAEKLRADLAPTVMRSWCVFTAPLIFGFVYLRPENRVPMMGVVGACWNTYMSWVVARDKG